MKLTKSLIFFTIIMFQLCSNSVIKRETNKNRTVEELRQKIISYLEDIYDLDKLIRKLEINMINPLELYQLYISFYQIILQ